MSEKVKELVAEPKIAKSYILVYQRPDGQKQLLCSYEMSEDIDFLISQIKNKKLDLPLEGFKNEKQFSMLEIPHNVSFGLNLPSVDFRKLELDNLMSELENAVSEMETDNKEITNL
jgi:hypothetical protein|tara:strand:+ start:156 stop:503 length:348 start_codon:yes stop_codon:yes gene_type:complete